MAKSILRERILLGMLTLSVTFAIPTFKQDIEYLAQKSVLKHDSYLSKIIKQKKIKRVFNGDFQMNEVLFYEEDYDLEGSEKVDYGEMRMYYLSKDKEQILSRYPFMFAFDLDQSNTFEPCEVLYDQKMDGINGNEKVMSGCKTEKELKEYLSQMDKGNLENRSNRITKEFLKRCNKRTNIKEQKISL